MILYGLVQECMVLMMIVSGGCFVGAAYKDAL